MILYLFGFFVLLSLVLIVIGLTRPSESAQAIIGFFFLFILAVTVLIPGSLEYPAGFEEDYVYGNNFTGYHWDYTYGGPPVVNDVYLFHINRSLKYYNFDDTTGGTSFGYWLAVASAVGMAGVFFSLKNTNWRQE